MMTLDDALFTLLWFVLGIFARALYVIVFFPACVLGWVLWLIAGIEWTDPIDFVGRYMIDPFKLSRLRRR